MTNSRPPQILLTDADGLASLTEPALLILDITKKDIRSGNIASVLERLHVLTDTPGSVVRYRESLVFQVGGYDSDRRELPEVAEVRAFFKQLTSAWPHWPWFLARGMGNLALLMSLLCDVKVVRGFKTYGTEFQDIDELKAVFGDLVSRQRPLIEAMEIDEAAVQDSCRSAAAELFI